MLIDFKFYRERVAILLKRSIFTSCLFVVLTTFIPPTLAASPWEWRISAPGVGTPGTYPTKGAAVSAMQALVPEGPLLTNETLTQASDGEIRYNYHADPVSAYPTSEWWYHMEPPGTTYSESEALQSHLDYYHITGCPAPTVVNPGEWRVIGTYANLATTEVKDVEIQIPFHSQPNDNCPNVGQRNISLVRNRTATCPDLYNNRDNSCRITREVAITGTPLICAAAEGPVYVGNPCSVLNGDKSATTTDYNSATLQFSRSYHTQDQALTSVMGAGWRHNWSDQLLIVNGTPRAIVKSSGYMEPLKTITTNSHYASTLAKGSEVIAQNGQWLQITAGLKTRFDNQGTLLQREIRPGIWVNISYENDQISTLSDTFGHQLTFEYDANGRLSTLHDSAQNTYQYTYGAHNTLIAVTYPDDSQRQYLYEDINFPTFLTGIIDEEGNRYATYAYDSSGRVNLSEHADGAGRVTLSYTASSTTVTESIDLGKTRVHTYHFTSINGRRRLTQISGDPSPALQSQTFANGYPQTHTDANGNVTHYQYNALGLLEQETEAYGTALARSRITEYHPSLRLPTRITVPGRTTDTTYDNHGNRLSEILTDTTGLCADGQGNGCVRTTTYTYNAQHQLVSIDGPRSAVNDVTTFTYDSFGNRVKITNALGHITQIPDYDAHGNPLTLIDPNGVRMELVYDARQRLLSRTLAAGTPDAATTAFTYDAAGNLIRLTQAHGSFIQYDYDAAHRLIGIEDHLGNRIDYTLDAMGHRTQTQIRDPNGQLSQTQSAVFNSLGRMIEQLGADQQSTAYAYDANGNTTTVTNPKQHTTTQAFDALNRLLETVDPDNGVTAYRYDARDNLTQVTDPKGLVTTYVYNGFGELLQQTSPDTQTATFQYDAAGNRIAQTDARGIEVHAVYDALNRLTFVDYPGTVEDITYTYDQTTGGNNGIGRLTSFTDPSGSTGYVYDVRGNVIRKTLSLFGQSYTIRYAYTPADQLSAIVHPNGRRIDYSYNSHSQITAVTATQHGHTQILADGITYLPFGPLHHLTHSNGLTRALNFDLDYRLETLNDGPLDRHYGYDPAGNLRDMLDVQNNTHNQHLSYDPLNRLTSAADAADDFNYTYDRIGNRLTHRHNGASTDYSYHPGSHRLQQRGSHQYQYDAAGNTQIEADDSGATLYTYNPHNRLSARLRGNDTTLMLYNALGQRVAKIHNGTPILYFYDEAGQLIGEQDLNHNSRADYAYLHGQPLALLPPRPDLWDSAVTLPLTDLHVPGQSATVKLDLNARTVTLTRSDGTPLNYSNLPQWELIHYGDQRYLEAADPNGAGTGDGLSFVLYLHADRTLGYLQLTPQDGSAMREYYYDAPAEEPRIYPMHNDHLGTPQRLTDQNQQVVWSARYTPFGQATVNEDPDGDGNNVVNNIRFPGQYFDVETGLHYNYHRYYDPKIGRYITSDPIGLRASLNTYAYVENNPIKFIDPLGLDVFICGRPANLPFPLGLFNHEWILTDTIEAGMGAAGGGVPAQNGNSDLPYVTPVEVVDHSRESLAENAHCDKVENVDEECVKKLIKIKRPLGRFGPTNNCQTFVMDVIIACDTSKKNKK